MGGLGLPGFPNYFSEKADFPNETHTAPASASEGAPEAPPRTLGPQEAQFEEQELGIQG